MKDEECRHCWHLIDRGSLTYPENPEHPNRPAKYQCCWCGRIVGAAETARAKKHGTFGFYGAKK